MIEKNSNQHIIPKLEVVDLNFSYSFAHRLYRAHDHRGARNQRVGRDLGHNTHLGTMACNQSAHSLF